MKNYIFNAMQEGAGRSMPEEKTVLNVEIYIFIQCENGPTGAGKRRKQC